MNTAAGHIPCPPMPICIDLPAAPNDLIHRDATNGQDARSTELLRALPQSPGVFALEDESGGTLALATTANLRRMIASKLAPPPLDPSEPPTSDSPIAPRSSRRIPYRSLTRRVFALPVESAFEADWAYLQIARVRLPLTYRAALDRWQSWFIHCDPAAAFPQLVKAAHPGRLPVPTGVWLGPVRDKHAAARYMEGLQDTFDLCRYHHILVQSPRGSACAYKEMGRCPAPCDGSVTMEHYHRQIRDAIDFAGTPISEWMQSIQTRMTEASAKLDFETAQRLRDVLDRAAFATKPEYEWVDRFERFRFLAVMTSASGEGVRVFLIRGGWIQPLGDLPFDADAAPIPTPPACEAMIESAKRMLDSQPSDFGEAGQENIGVVCWHLFHPKRAQRGEFVRVRESTSAQQLTKTLRRLAKQRERAASAAAEPSVEERDMEAER